MRSVGRAPQLELAARADRLVDAAMQERRRAFVLAVAQGDADAAKAGAYGSSAYCQMRRNICATELHERTGMHVAALLASHRAMSAAASDAVRTACKGWIAERIADDAGDLKQYLAQANPAFAPPGHVSKPDDLHAESQRELESAYAKIDNEFDRLQRNVVERLWRWAVRAYRIAQIATAGVGRAPTTP